MNASTNTATSPYHRLGTSFAPGTPAAPVIESALGFNVWAEPLYDGSGEKVPGHKMIKRSPTSDDPEERILNVVTSGYRLLSPKRFAELWDQNVVDPFLRPRGIETIGAYKRGGIVYFTTPLPDIEVGGDLVKHWLVAENNMLGTGAINVYITGLRLVCGNMLAAARLSAVERHSIKHTQAVEKNLAAWLGRIWNRALMRHEQHEKAYQAMAGKVVSLEEYNRFKETVYPMPSKPIRDHAATQEQYEQREYRHKLEAGRIVRLRQSLDLRWIGAVEFVDNAPTGYSPDNAPQSAWDLWQCQSHIANHYRPRATDAIALATNIVSGDRRRQIERGFYYAYALA